MSFTREQFYNEAIRPNLARFSSEVKVKEILLHLPCLTLSDREEVEAKKDMSGNFTAMQTLLDNLRRREKWPDQFITALRNCECRELADEMNAIYDRIRGVTNNAAPAAPTPRPAPTPAPSYTSAGATTSVATATIHTVPATTSSLLTPSSGGASASSTAPSNTAAPEPSTAPAPETQQVQKPSTSVPEPSPEPVSQAKITPPVVAPSQKPPPALPVRQNLPTHTGAAENKTPALDNSDVLSLTDQTTISSSAGEALLSTSSAQASSSDTSTSQSQMTKPYTTSQTSPKPKKTEVLKADGKDIDTSEKVPVQDTNPPLRMERTFQEPEEISDPTATQVVQRHNTVELPDLDAPTNSTRTSQATSSAPAEVVTHSPSSMEPEYFSKPGVLQELQQTRAENLSPLQVEPCSTVSADLEISRAAEPSTEPGQSTSPAEQTFAPLASLDSATRSFQNSNQPEEDHYESYCESQTRINVIRFAEEPPAENMNGQPPSILQRSRVFSEDQHTLTYDGTESAVHLLEPSKHESTKSTTINVRKEESNAARTDQREEGRQELFRINNFHLIAATGIGLSAMFLAWKFAHK
ncbi:mitochondrial antiviral-signaling protein [Garra rufa]|uniref:mitochondrial antiviral-signaling protein n=1 Tax=Garra rufa TaxID=137080 RepID=UPI003CCE7034